jgi:hypothetical protein
MAEDKIACDVCHRPILSCVCGQEIESPWINPNDTGVYEGDTN